MKLLIDDNISWRLGKCLQDVFPGSIHVSRCGLPTPAGDWAIHDFAKRNDYILLTQDDDFEVISLLRGVPPKVILLRTGNMRVRDMEQILRGGLDEIFEFLREEDKCVLHIMPA